MHNQSINDSDDEQVCEQTAAPGALAGRSKYPGNLQLQEKEELFVVGRLQADRKSVV